MDEEIIGPWDVEVKLLLDAGVETLDRAREHVCIHYFRYGDPKPFCNWTRRGFVPSADLLRIIAAVLDPDPLSEKHFPYWFKRTARNKGQGGRPVDPSTELRNDLIAQLVQRSRDRGDGYDAAIAEVKQLVESDGAKIDTKTVRNAYERWIAKQKSVSSSKGN